MYFWNSCSSILKLFFVSRKRKLKKNNSMIIKINIPCASDKINKLENRETVSKTEIILAAILTLGVQGREMSDILSSRRFNALLKRTTC